jgi:hypothetical protein
MRLTPAEPDIRTIVERINNGDIDLQPDFQRQEVWPKKKQRRLIDTVLRGWSIPPIHLVATDESTLEVLDGQQRLAALRDFVNNRFTIDGFITPEDQRIEMLHRKFYRQLDPPVRRKIDHYAIRCFYITDYRPEEPSELFYRLNQPTMLTAGEQRNALFGPARQQLKELVGRFDDLGNNRDTIGFSNLRLAYDDVLARLLYFLEAENFGLKSTEARISERFRTQQPFDEQVWHRASAAVEIYSLARHAAGGYRFNKASLLSWLIFFSRFTEGVDVSVQAINRFVEAGNPRNSVRSVRDAVELFNDRASLRVTDVSSVVYRDFALCYVYHILGEGRLPSRVDTNVIVDVQRELARYPDKPFELVLEGAIDIDRWSHSL